MNIPKTIPTKLKRDYITFFAFFLFFLLIMFQIFITVVAPIYIRRHSALDVEKQREEMFHEIDDARQAANRAGTKDAGAKAEKNLVIQTLDELAYYIRTNYPNMTAEQIADVRNRIRKNRMIVERWKNDKTAPFHIKQNLLDLNESMNRIKQSLDLNTETNPKNSK